MSSILKMKNLYFLFASVLLIGLLVVIYKNYVVFHTDNGLYFDKKVRVATVYDFSGKALCEKWSDRCVECERKNGVEECRPTENANSGLCSRVGISNSNLLALFDDRKVNRLVQCNKWSLSNFRKDCQKYKVFCKECNLPNSNCDLKYCSPNALNEFYKVLQCAN